MNQRFTRNSDSSMTFTREVAFTITAGASMLDAENALMQKVNATGCELTEDLPASFDTSGLPMVREGIRPAAKRKKEKALY